VDSTPQAALTHDGREPELAHAPMAKQVGAGGAGTVPRRLRFVVGVFFAPVQAKGAIERLASEGCEILVVSDAAPSPTATGTEGATETGRRVVLRHLDASGSPAPASAVTLDRFGPFATLGSDLGNEHAEATPARGAGRLFQSLARHLASGAAIAIVHAPGSERQLRISHVLLDAKCDILLTHDILPPADVASVTPARSDECCDTCDRASCRKLDPSQDGSAAEDGANS